MQSFSDQNRANKKWIAAGAGIVLLVVVILFLRGALGGRGRGGAYRLLRCVLSQQVTPFDDRILYYDGTTLHCINANDDELWKYVLGPNAGFSVSDQLVVAWAGEHLHILDKNGRVTYNDRLSDPIQLARAGNQYVAAVIGKTVGPTLVVKDINGLAVDSETVAYEDKAILDMGFFERGEYLWTTAMDIFGIAPQTLMNMYRVGAMNTGEIDLGEEITYAVVYSGGKLHVVNTLEINQYDYRGTLFPYEKRLVWGWKLIDYAQGAGGALMLLVPQLQTADEQKITELRVLADKKDSRYTLPDTCVGACIRGNKLYAVSADTIFHADLASQRFYSRQLDMPQPITGYLGKLNNNQILVSCGDAVYSIALP